VKDDERLQRLARLAVEVGANVQRGQTVVVTAHVEQAPLAREIARAAYRAGASMVYPEYIDRHFERALIELGPRESLALSSAGDVALLEDLVARKGAVIRIRSEPAPDLLKDLDQTRVGMLMPIDYLRRWRDAVGGRKVNWTIVTLPNPAWALQVFGDDLIATHTRLDLSAGSEVGTGQEVASLATVNAADEGLFIVQPPEKQQLLFERLKRFEYLAEFHLFAFALRPPLFAVKAISGEEKGQPHWRLRGVFVRRVFIGH